MKSNEVEINIPEQSEIERRVKIGDLIDKLDMVSQEERVAIVAEIHKLDSLNPHKGQ